MKTKRQIAKAKYLKSPYHCPRCNSGDIEAQPQAGEFNEGYKGKKPTASMPVICPDCGYRWIEIYSLTNIKVERKG
jgi:predicted Zn-ribbon and HTH transcriptional regulator